MIPYFSLGVVGFGMTKEEGLSADVAFLKKDDFAQTREAITLV
jgi:hypothetical protein